MTVPPGSVQVRDGSSARNEPSSAPCVSGRLTPSGDDLEPLTDDALAAAMAAAPDAVAINLLFSFVDDRNERRIEAALPASTFVSRSSAVLPEVREYERGIATWLNARVGPVMAGYLGRLRAALPRARLSVMQSSAGPDSSRCTARPAACSADTVPAELCITASRAPGNAARSRPR